MRVLSARLRDWVPQLGLEQIGQVLRDTVAGYRQVPDKPEQLRAVRTTLAQGVGVDRRPQIITDLHAIAVADGRFDVAEQEFIEATARALGLTPEPVIHSLAIIYLALAHAADGEIDAGELRVVAERLQQWTPNSSLVEIGAVLRDAVAEYKRLPGAEARLNHARAAADSLKQTTPRDTLRRILADLWRIAGSDGHISSEEQRFIMEMVGRFNA
jgi:tellurite resistance protein